LPDLLDERVELLFVGLTPGLKSAMVGHYYAGPGNLFWRCLHESGLTSERLRPEEDWRLPEFGIGVTDCVARPTRGLGDLSPAELRAGFGPLVAKIERFQPILVCFNGLSGLRAMLGRPVAPGLQDGLILGGAAVFAVPSTSAANAGYSREERVEWFRVLKATFDAFGRSAAGSNQQPGR
jgi:TDG/mug DNA glycosylase family protein